MLQPLTSNTIPDAQGSQFLYRRDCVRKAAMGSDFSVVLPFQRQILKMGRLSSEKSVIPPSIPSVIERTSVFRRQAEHILSSIVTPKVFYRVYHYHSLHHSKTKKVT